MKGLGSPPWGEEGSGRPPKLLSSGCMDSCGECQALGSEPLLSFWGPPPPRPSSHGCPSPMEAGWGPSGRIPPEPGACATAWLPGPQCPAELCSQAGSVTPAPVPRWQWPLAVKARREGCTPPSWKPQKLAGGGCGGVGLGRTRLCAWTTPRTPGRAASAQSWGASHSGWHLRLL